MAEPLPPASAAFPVVRRVIRADAEALDALWMAFVREQSAADPRLAPSPEAGRLWAGTRREAVDTGTPAVWVAEDAGGALVGFVVAEPFAASPVYADAREVYVGELYVAPAARRTGLARRLLDAATDWATAEGADRLRFDIARGNAAAESLVAAWNARPLATTYTRDL